MMKTNFPNASATCLPFFRICLCVIVTCTLFLTACSDNKPIETQDTKQNDTPERPEVEEEVNLAKATPFPVPVQCYTTLFRSSGCAIKANFMDSTGPLFCSDVKKAVLDFGSLYTAPNLDYFPTYLTFDKSSADTLIDIIERYDKNNNHGFVFHYGFKEQNGNGKIVYILSNGTLCNESQTRDSLVKYEPFQNQDGGYYVLLEPYNNKAYQIIDQTLFDRLKGNYYTSMQVDGGGTLRNIGTNDPLMVYHSREGFHEFYREYKDSTNLHLYIGHGAIQKPGGKFPFHTPCFIFGDANQFFQLNNTDNSSTPTPYLNKALDLGRLCPPNCPSQQVPCTPIIPTH